MGEMQRFSPEDDLTRVNHTLIPVLGTGTDCALNLDLNARQFTPIGTKAPATVPNGWGI